MSSLPVSPATMDAPASSAVIEVLRDRTRPLHERLETGIDLQRSLVSPTEYAALLSRYLGIYRPFEALLGSRSTAIRGATQWPERARTPLLEQDLYALGWSSEQIAAVPNCPLLPELASDSAMLGALYVVEGSNLGGQYIYRQIETTTANNKDRGAAFFYGDGPNTGQNWKRFKDALELHTTDAEEASDAACAMFETFEVWLGGATKH